MAFEGHKNRTKKCRWVPISGMYLVSFTRNPLNREWGSQAMHSTYAVISGHAPSATQVCILRWRACQECGKCMYSLYGFLFNPSSQTNGAIILQLSGKTNRDHSFFGKGFSKLKKRLRLGISKLYGTSRNEKVFNTHENDRFRIHRN